jgi:hypothetical protein
MKPIIAWFANNHIAANLLMLLSIMSGLAHFLISKSQLLQSLCLTLVPLLKKLSRVSA